MKDPAVLFYTSDFLVGTIAMTNEQVGAYIKLLCLQHAGNGKVTRQQVDMVGADDAVMDKFVEDENGDFYNVRMRSESDRRKAYAESRAANRRKKDNDTSLEVPNKARIEPVITDESVIVPEVLDAEFEEIWDEYGRKGNKKTSQKKWNRLKKSDREKIKAVVPDYVKATPDRQYRKNFETYLNQEAWNDQVETNGEQQTSNTDGLCVSNRADGKNPFGHNAADARAQREMLRALSNAVLQQH